MIYYAAKLSVESLSQADPARFGMFADVAEQIFSGLQAQTAMTASVVSLDAKEATAPEGVSLEDLLPEAPQHEIVVAEEEKEEPSGKRKLKAILA